MNYNEFIKKEIAAQMFAQALLMPKELVVNALQNGNTVNDISKMFGVPKHTVSSRIQNLNISSKQGY